MTHDEMISMIQAQKAGKTIQWSTDDIEGLWITADKNLWAYGDVQFRVAPEDTIRYATLYADGSKYCVYSTQLNADNVKFTFDGVTKKLKAVEMI